LFPVVFTLLANADEGLITKGGTGGEKRSFIQAVDGYAYLSETMNLADIREMAFTNAKKKAVKMTSSYIKSKTRIENFVLKEDILESNSEGMVTILEEKDHGIVGNDRYHVWIKAEVVFDLDLRDEKKSSFSAESVIPQGTLNPDAPLTVQVWTAKKVFQPGEDVIVYMKGNRDFYARIVDITTDGNIVQLLPNRFRSDSFFKGGQLYKVPDGDDQFSLQVSPPYGNDHIIVYASDNPLGEVDLEGTAGGLGLFRGSAKNLALQTRGIAVVGSKKEETAGAEFYERTWSFTTQP
jgi:hypothetical protein